MKKTINKIVENFLKQAKDCEWLLMSKKELKEFVDDLAWEFEDNIKKNKRKCRKSLKK